MSQMSAILYQCINTFSVNKWDVNN
jgi:hypothetical protein